MSTFICMAIGGIIGNIIWMVANAPTPTRRPVNRRTV
jgi:hypothetical protein